MKNNSLPVMLLIFVLPFVLFAQGENWIFTYDGCNSGVGRSIIYGPDGKIYAAGTCHANAVDDYFTVISLTPAGDTSWVYWYSGGWYSNVAQSIDYGSDGNIYAAGYTRSGPTFMHFTMASLAPNGEPNWVYRYQSTYHYDQATSVDCGLDGQIYSAGSLENSSYGRDLMVMSMTDAMDTNWVRINAFPGGAGYFDNDQANSVIFGADSNIYTAGVSDTGSSYEDFIVISFTPIGNTNWIYRYNGPANGRDCANSIVYGEDDNIYAAGWSTGYGSLADLAVVSLTPGGNVNWVFRYEGPVDSNDFATSIVYGGDGNLYVAGYSVGIYSDYDFIVISLTPAGDSNWVFRYNGPGNGADAAYSLVYGDDGNIYAAGYSTGTGTDLDFTVISLAQNGDVNAIYRYNGSGNGADAAYSLVYGDDGNIYVAGRSMGLGFDGYFTVISLPAGDLGVYEQRTSVGTWQNYSPTIFSGPLILPEGKQCRVFDITGRVVIPEMMKPGVYFVEFDGDIVQKVIKIH